MTQGFYEQLGVEPGARTDEIRRAYARLVAQLGRRRRAVVERGGDPEPLDLARVQADEAWDVLSDPARRRRYDAMRAVANDGMSADSAELWRRVAGSLVHPAAAAAAELLRVATNLKVGALPPAPRLPGADRPRPAPTEDEVTLTGSTASLNPRPSAPRPAASATLRLAEGTDPGAEPKPEAPAKVVALPTAAAKAPDTAFRVVEGTRAGPSVVVLPPQGQQRKKPLSAEDVARLVDKHGHSGALLQAVREARGVSLSEMAESTRISARYLEAIEADQYDRLPSPTFVRGYVREMARTLELDEEATVAGYMRRLTGA